ncbi:aliphatic sulfonate ABC transporter substrate-binding protein [Pseudomonas sp. GD04087]|uniref:aliphatic sulfonate ABC transporter substrate-binding protein n=1 Tax=unclassified Pseudomonas TaxID=196821 RepID=UPI00244A0017|nr:MULTISPECIES: aliphatic sulfonate ABC transporter substrate-binding protein [unclassified Pseudomonas]MDH0287577.1 aliphatic sulfonate ABC transporter substrate-binding protein [Pseudomonas sp. GD04087]MDH1047801.1 aliphatic sulfonate ABC transporter substrate-binding protein [Pseudomonas sp. GD03903]MDH1998775.1 aliphatic sulfonate ABC transporter substrate-binding protein [Pseudomonas sp. GD03691]
MGHSTWRRSLAVALLASLPIGAYNSPIQAADAPREVRLDYAYYAPTSLVLKHFGWLEKSLKPQGTEVRWVFSQGSNRSLEYLNAGSTDFASTAGLAAVLSRANGAPLKTVYIASRPEWTALVVPKDSPLKSVADLKGKKIAATKGTDPYLFLLRSLQQAGLDKNDVEIVHLQHPDGRAALEQGRVDAWAGLDPHMAASELQAGSRLLYRNVDFNSYGVLSVTEKFEQEQPALIKQVIAAYEEARQWAIAHPKETAKLLAEEAKLPLEVAKLQLSRTDFSKPLPGAEQVAALKAAAPILVDEQLVRPGTDVTAVVDQLIAPQLAGEVIGKAGAVAKAEQ